MFTSDPGGGTWEVLVGGVVGRESRTCIQDKITEGQAARYYRIIEVSPDLD